MAYIDYTYNVDIFLKAHGEFFINKYLEQHDYKTFCIHSNIGLGYIMPDVFDLMISTIDYLGYDIYKVDMNELKFEDKQKYRNTIYFGMHTMRLSRFRNYDTHKPSTKNIEDIATKENKPSSYNLSDYVLRRRSDNEFVALTSEIYPFDLENDIFNARKIVDYLHTNKGIKCGSSVSASTSKGTTPFVFAFLDVEIDENFEKYIHYASHLPVVENTYPHVINRWGSNKYSRPKRYNPIDLQRAKVNNGEVIDGLTLDDFSKYDNIIKYCILIFTLFLIAVVYFSK